VPVFRALRAELGKDKADAVVKQAPRDWSKQLFAAIGEGIEGSPRRKWATIQSVWDEVSGKDVCKVAAGGSPQTHRLRSWIPFG
jgi:hypothetical protein